MIFNSVAEIYESIDNTRSALLEILGSLDQDQKQAKENEDGWTITQIAEHLAIVENGMTRIIGRLLSQAEEEGIASNGTFDSPVSMEQIIELSKNNPKAEAPDRVHPTGNQAFEESVVKLSENRKVLHEIRGKIEAINASKHTFPHPFFKELTAYQWLAMVGLHEMRHLGQIKRILEKAASSGAAAS